MHTKRRCTVPYRFLENLITSFYILDHSSHYTHLGTPMHTIFIKRSNIESQSNLFNLDYNNSVSSTLYLLHFDARGIIRLDVDA